MRPVTAALRHGRRRGTRKAAAFMGDKTLTALAGWTDGGRLPVVVDASSCTGALREQAENVEILDSVEWIERLLPALDVPRIRSLAVHPTCSTRHMNQTTTL